MGLWDPGLVWEPRMERAGRSAKTALAIAATGMVGLAIAVSVAIVVGLMSAPPASAAQSGLVYAGCQSSPDGPVEPSCSQLEGLSYTGAFAVSLDGTSAYASFPDGVSVYRRAPDGQLSFQECFSATGEAPCTQVPGVLGTARDIAVPPDGRSVYLAGSSRRETLIGFQRDPADGTLTFSSCSVSDYGGGPGPPGCPLGPFQRALQVESSRDGRTIYVADEGCADNTGECFASVGVYTRDPATSLLTPSGRSRPATQGHGPFAVTPVGGTVYELDSDFGTISVHKRIGGSGLKRTQCLWPRKRRFYGPCKRVRKMGKAEAIAVSPHGSSVVTVVNPKRGKSWLTLFDRARNGKLSFERRAFDKRLRSVSDLRFTSDGTLIAASGAGEDSFLLRFKVNPKRGTVALAQCLSSAKRSGCTRLPELRGLSEIAVREPHLYATVADLATGSGLNAVLRFRAAG